MELRFTTEYDYDLTKQGIAVPVSLKVGNQEAHFEARVDTGASYCFFERYLGEALQLEIESGDRLVVGTATGSFIAYGHTVTLTVLGEEFDSIVYFAESDAFTRNVLGRNGWLNRIKLGVVEYEGRLYIGRYE